MLVRNLVLSDPIFGVLGAINDNYRAVGFVVREKYVKIDGTFDLRLEIPLKADMPTSTKGLPARTMWITVPAAAEDYALYRRMMFEALN